MMLGLFSCGRYSKNPIVDVVILPFLNAVFLFSHGLMVVVVVVVEIIFLSILPL
jgi:hypothetical protein